MISIPVRAMTRRAERLAVITWAGPGEPVKVAPGSTLTTGERLAVLRHLTEARPAELGDAAGPLAPAPEDWHPTSSVEGLTAALTSLGGATGVAPLWDQAEGLALEVAE